MGYYYYGYGIDFAYYGIVILSLFLGLVTQSYIKRKYERWSKVDASFDGTGADVARQMLNEGGASSVGITSVAGHLTDYYDPRDNNLHLSEENMRGGSVASVAVACHEAGHAVQHAKDYVPMRVRTALVPVVNFSQNVWMLVFLAGVFMNAVGLVRIAIALFAFSVIFQLVTLPVEINASRRAVQFLETHGQGIDRQGAKEVLTAAALTYVAAALVSVVQLLYLIGRQEGLAHGGHQGGAALGNRSGAGGQGPGGADPHPLGHGRGKWLPRAKRPLRALLLRGQGCHGGHVDHRLARCLP